MEKEISDRVVERDDKLVVYQLGNSYFQTRNLDMTVQKFNTTHNCLESYWWLFWTFICDYFRHYW